MRRRAQCAIERNTTSTLRAGESSGRPRRLADRVILVEMRGVEGVVVPKESVAASRGGDVVCFGRWMRGLKDGESGLTLEKTINDRVEVDILRLVRHGDLKKKSVEKGKRGEGVDSRREDCKLNTQRRQDQRGTLSVASQATEREDGKESRLEAAAAPGSRASSTGALAVPPTL